MPNQKRMKYLAIIRISEKKSMKKVCLATPFPFQIHSPLCSILCHAPGHWHVEIYHQISCALPAGEARGILEEEMRTWSRLWPWFPSFEVTSVWLSPLKRWHYCTQNGLFYTIPFGSENLSYSTSPLYVGRVTFASVTKVLGFCTNLCIFPRLQPFFFNLALYK